MSGAGASKHTEESAAASVAAQNKNTDSVSFENYEKVLSLLDRILFLLGQLDMEKKRSDFENNQNEIKKLVLELFSSNLPLNEGNIATLKKEIITRGGRGSRYKAIWAIVGPKKENPFKRQADGSYGIGENSLFSVNSENPEDITQNMPTEPYYGDGNDYSPGRFHAYYVVVQHVKDEIIKFMKILPGGEDYLLAKEKFQGGRRRRRRRKKTKKKRKSKKGGKRRKRRKTRKRRKSKKRRR